MHCSYLHSIIVIITLTDTWDHQSHSQLTQETTDCSTRFANLIRLSGYFQVGTEPAKTILAKCLQKFANHFSKRLQNLHSPLLYWYTHQPIWTISTRPHQQHWLLSVCVCKPKLAWARGIGVLFECVVLHTHTHTHTNIRQFPRASRGRMGEGTLALRMYIHH